MPRPLFRRQGLARMGALAIAFVSVAPLAGCDVSEDADLERGRSLFQAKCGTCHVLAEANSAGTLGPSLDAAFADARASGMDNDTIEGVVQAQISNPRQIDENLPDEEYNRVFMPADIVTGQDAENVAAYVASVAGVPGIEPPKLPPDQLFTELGCGGCHTLAAAGTAGAQGPNLDDVLPGQSAQQIDQSIVDPNAKPSPGFQPNVMPQDYEQRLTPQQLQGLVQYLLENAGQGGG